LAYEVQLLCQIFVITCLAAGLPDWLPSLYLI